MAGVDFLIGQTVCGGRFEIHRELGAGGMGTVYAAWDRELDVWVAIKTLSRVEPASLYRFKREFRDFAELRHPGLLRLHELFEERGRFFFTMELLAGDNLLEALQSNGRYGAGQLDVDASRPSAPVANYQRVRRLFRQIAESLRFLHDAGKVHRDLKPENVLVDAQDRTILLDFGIGVSRGMDGSLDTFDEGFVGTPAYMAPEMQDRGGDERSDWYAFGGMLYEALVGQLPFEDRSIARLLQRKQREAPAAPHERVSSVPRDLSDLVIALLAKEPSLRPQGHDVIARLADRGSPEPPQATVARQSDLFVGRAAELELLRAAVAQAADEHPRIVLMHGPSGIGKSSLARKFLRVHADDAEAWVITGACHEFESLRFKAFDGLIDALTRRIATLPDDEAAGLMPRRIAALTATFPVLARVPVFGPMRRPNRFELPADPVELRTQAFDALRELLAATALRFRLVLFIDDFQWSDLDSVALLRALIIGPGAPGLLLLCTFRTDDIADSVALQALTQLQHEVPLPFSTITLAPLEMPEVLELGQRLGKAVTATDLALVSPDAYGNPFLLSEMLARRADAGVQLPDGAPDLLQILGNRFDALSRNGRELLELLSVAGKPTERAIYVAAHWSEGEVNAAVAELRGAQLIRAVGRREVLAPYHDRIRDTAVKLISSARRAELHERLATSLASSADPDFEALARHWIGAGRPAEGAKCAARAAQRYAEQLAFARASDLYRLALDHESHAARRQELRSGLATALIHAGYRAEAADVFLDGLPEARDNVEAFNLRQRAGQELLLSGHVARGTALLQDALAELGSPLQTELGAALEAWGAQHARLHARGLSVKPRDLDQPMPTALAMRLDTLWAAGFGLNRFAGLRVYTALAQHLFEALECGDTVRVVRGLCMYHALADYPAHLIGGGELLGAREAAESMLGAKDEPLCRSWMLIAQGFEHWFRGRQEALAYFHEAAELLQHRCIGATPELGFAQQMIVGHYMAVGAWDLAARDCQRFGAEAASRDDRLYDYIFELRHVFAALMAGDHRAAATQMDRGLELARLRQNETTFPVRFAHGHVASVTGDVAALQDVLAWTKSFKHSPEARLPNFKMFVRLNEGRFAAAIAKHSRGEVRERCLREADDAYTAASALGLEALSAPVLMARAGLALAEGRQHVAMTFLEAAIAQAPAYAGLIAELARYHHARLGSDDAGRALAREALHARGVVDVDTITSSLAPFLSNHSGSDCY